MRGTFAAARRDAVYQFRIHHDGREKEEVEDEPGVKTREKMNVGG